MFPLMRLVVRRVFNCVLYVLFILQSTIITLSNISSCKCLSPSVGCIFPFFKRLLLQENYWCCLACTAVLRSANRFPIMFCSRYLEGHGKNLQLLPLQVSYDQTALFPLVFNRRKGDLFNEILHILLKTYFCSSQLERFTPTSSVHRTCFHLSSLFNWRFLIQKFTVGEIFH